MIPKPLHAANELLAFLLELAAFGSMTWWGFRTGSGVPVHLLLGLGTPAAAITLWGLFCAPRATFKVPLFWVMLLKAAVFGGAALCVYAVGHHALGIAFAIVAALNTALATADREALVHTRRA
ncbi:YrdB family protein [Streptacidiphilus sp. EB129]|uniref:YrdB family protein n=1 Tax=Streptacidiphilus sp. EB129 TaxID=3156262 RepID=UPI003515C0FC